MYDSAYIGVGMFACNGYLCGKNTRMRRLVVMMLLVLSAHSAVAQHGCQGVESLKQWCAGDVVSIRDIEMFGIDNCFGHSAIDSIVFGRIYGRSYKADCTVPISDLRYVRALHVDADNRILIGEMICHKSISDDVVTILKTLFEHGYPIERMVLIDEYDADDERSMQANNSSSFNFRYISGTSKLSNHSEGLAVDINPGYNPYVRQRNGVTVVEPSCAAPYADRTGSYPYKIVPGDICHSLFISHGFIWGGNWKSVKDYQHFEKRQ